MTSFEPNYDALFSHDGVEFLEACADEYQSPETFVKMLEAAYGGMPMYIGIGEQAGIFVEPDETGFDDFLADSPHEAAFMRGVLPALHVVTNHLSVAHRDDMYHLIYNDFCADIPLPGDDGDDADRQEIIRAETAKVIQAADQGYNATPAYHRLIGAWSDEIETNVMHRPYFRRGFGFVIHLAQKTQILRSQEELRERASQEKAGAELTDWDAAFKEMTGEQEDQ